MTNWTRILAFAGSASILAAQSSVQPTPAPAQVIQTTSREVLLEVSARDKRGRPVRNLGQDQFRITENGEPMKITGFRLVEKEKKDEAAEPGGNPPVARFDPAKQASLISLVFDRLGLDGRRLSRQAALDLLETAAGPKVYFSVFTIDQRLSVLQPFSDDLAALKRAVTKATQGTPSEFAAQSDNLKSALKSMVIPPEHAALATAHAGADSAAPSPAAGSDLSADRERAAMILSMLNFSEAAARSQQGRSSIFSLTSLIAEQDHYRGIKTVVYFSEGIHVPINLTLQFQSLIATAKRANVQIYSVDATGLTATGRSDAARAELEQALQFSAEEMASRIGDHEREQKNAVTPERAKSGERGEESIRANLQNSLAELAESTGGQLVANTNDPRKLLRRVADDLSTHYEMTYVPSIRRYDGQFRRIEARVTRRDVQVHTRDGYFALPLANRESLHAYEVPLLRSLQELNPPTAFPVQAGAFHFGPVQNGIECALSVEVPLANVTFVEDQHSGVYQVHLSALGLIKNGDGEVVEKITHNVPIEVPTGKLPGFRRGSFVWVEHRILSPGHYTLEAAVLDQNAERVSTRRVAFFVPAPTPGPALSSVSLIRHVEPETDALDAQDPFRFSGGKVTPTLSTSVPGGPESTLSLYFVIYPNRSISKQPELAVDLIRDGKLLSTSAPPLGKSEPDGRIPYLVVAPTRALEPGTYQMRVTARQGAAAAEQSTWFTLIRSR